MENVTFIKVQEISGEVEHALIDNGDGSFTSMTKEHWDKLEAEREQSGTL